MLKECKKGSCDNCANKRIKIIEGKPVKNICIYGQIRQLIMKKDKECKYWTQGL